MLAADIEGFDGSQYGDKPGVPEDVLSDAETFYGRRRMRIGSTKHLPTARSRNVQRSVGFHDLFYRQHW
jgi:hypothetical protein